MRTSVFRTPLSPTSGSGAWTHSTIAKAVLGAVSQVPGAGPVEVPAPPRLSVKWLRDVIQSSRVAAVYLVLDQFEEYFRYHPDDRGEDGLVGELGRILRTRDLQVNVLLSIREDALAALDQFKGRFEGLLNQVRTGHLVVEPEGVASGGAADGREDIEAPYCSSC